jgi:Tol biopolymer transport system component
MVVAAVGLAVGGTSTASEGTFAGGNGLIAFTRGTAAGWSIAVVEPDRSGFRTLIENAQQPAWSPDGHSIAFVRRSEQGDWDIFIANADGSGVRELVHPGRDDFQPAWSPDGSQIAYDDYARGRDLGQIDVVNVDGSGRRLVTDDQYMDTSPYAPVWSPDGQWILFNLVQGEFWLIHPDGSGTIKTDLTDGTALNRPSWSPDGKDLAFSNSDEGQIGVISVDGTGFRQLTHVYGGADEPAWSPDGREVVFAYETSTTKHGKTTWDDDLYIINADGSGLRPLVRGKADTDDPAWQPTTAAS